MLDYIKSLLGFSNRAQQATERAAKAIEGIADDLEMLRERQRKILGIDTLLSESVRVNNVPELPYTPEEEAEEPVKEWSNGKAHKRSKKG